MQISGKLAVAWAFAAGLTISAASADSLRCGNRIVTEEDRAAEVIATCGEPFWRSTWDDEVASELYGEIYWTTRHHEEWTYNFGPDQFVAFLHFQDGQLVSVRSGGYGFHIGSKPKGCEGGDGLAVGQHAGEVALSCGLPATRDRRELSRARKVGNSRISTTHFLEEWTYVYPGKTLILSFEDGTLAKIVWK